MQKKYLVIFCTFSCIFPAFCLENFPASAYFLAYFLHIRFIKYSCILFCCWFSLYLSNVLHICAILFRFLASTHLIGLLVHSLFDPCHDCFLVPVPYHFALGCCIWYRCLPAAASRFLCIIQSRIHAAPRRAAAPLPKPNLLLRRRSRSRPARHSLWRRCGRA
jgi:hypothetical protein